MAIRKLKVNNNITSKQLPFKKLIKKISGVAIRNKYNIFLVGGTVRDIFLRQKSFDIDIVVEGDAIRFGRTLREVLGGALVEHKRFGTASLYITHPKLKIDLATARKESYEHPAALPKVEFSSLKDDLLRRDFTVNAMAVSLNKGTFGQLIDFFNGIGDLRARRIHVLHEKSFIDDPTRIFRAVRLEQRLGFSIDHYTENLIITAVNEKMFSRTDNQRIRDELLLMLKEREPIKAIRRMNELHELKFIHKEIVFDARMEALFKACSEVYTWYNKKCPDKRILDLYIIYLMALTDRLSAGGMSRLCEKFVFKRSDKLRLMSYAANKSAVTLGLSRKVKIKPSAVYKILEPLSYETILMIMASTKKRAVRTNIEVFFRKYNGLKVMVTGNDLKALGLKAGPQFKTILNELLSAKLDGKIRNKKDEIEYLKDIKKRMLGKMDRRV